MTYELVHRLPFYELCQARVPGSMLEYHMRQLADATHVWVRPSCDGGALELSGEWSDADGERIARQAVKA